MQHERRDAQRRQPLGDGRAFMVGMDGVAAAGADDDGRAVGLPRRAGRSGSGWGDDGRPEGGAFGPERDGGRCHFRGVMPLLWALDGRGVKRLAALPDHVPPVPRHVLVAVHVPVRPPHRHALGPRRTPQARRGPACPRTTGKSRPRGTPASASDPPPSPPPAPRSRPGCTRAGPDQGEGEPVAGALALVVEQQRGRLRSPRPARPPARRCRSPPPPGPGRRSAAAGPVPPPALVIQRSACRRRCGTAGSAGGSAPPY